MTRIVLYSFAVLRSARQHLPSPARSIYFHRLSDSSITVLFRTNTPCVLRFPFTFPITARKVLLGSYIFPLRLRYKTLRNSRPPRFSSGHPIVFPFQRPSGLHDHRGFLQVIQHSFLFSVNISHHLKLYTFCNNSVSFTN
ncbi:uncharacterized protein LOC143266330 [Megachile rotundata]|uniref:uncharacterized protein LOC143266330 n=1 Tax=Megachile rotundata TaxID=143995 RepID=UPI003FCFEBD6